MTTPRTVQRFEVSLKAFITRADGCALLLRESDTGYWELPGGRIDAGEEWQAHDLVLAREIAEELGTDVRIETGPAAVTWTRQRPSDGVFQFIVARPCRLLTGTPLLSAEHDALDWIDAQRTATLSLPPGYRDGLERLWNITSGHRT